MEPSPHPVEPGTRFQEHRIGLKRDNIRYVIFTISRQAGLRNEPAKRLGGGIEEVQGLSVFLWNQSCPKTVFSNCGSPHAPALTMQIGVTANENGLGIAQKQGLM